MMSIAMCWGKLYKVLMGWNYKYKRLLTRGLKNGLKSSNIKPNGVMILPIKSGYVLLLTSLSCISITTITIVTINYKKIIVMMQ